MKQLMIIKADSNDADYVYELNYVSADELKFFNSVIPKLIEKEYGGYTWETGEIGNPYEEYAGILTEEEIDRFGEYVPYAEYGVHTIESIIIYDVTKETNLI